MLKRIVLVAGASLLLLLASPASAQTNPSGQQGQHVDSTASDNGTISCSGDGFKPGSDEEFSIASTPTVLGHATADASGHVTLTAPLPGNITPGTHTVTVSGIGANGQPLSLSTQVLVSAAAAANAARNAGVAPATTAPGSNLPRTGSDNSGLIRIGVLLVALGGGAVLVTRKRRAQLAA
jgi:LPXTG-motif cell wall-anchored protein